ncbi:hemerythrin domain-containing protein [Actinoallomurus iriomotensis]|uniref:Hemerythrin-like domain-containing protein n=1 Tax=Actinoallomurus iriomotensis TaxID=478107 RepID=A0A9W6RGF7_9ACTN|nr:hemerythrin domain-containing protein [Actinoallomurus iriomotensis]GLY75283.1 hypothetical protein Airi01_035500 [Actinoallomurus iriomotensis]
MIRVHAVSGVRLEESKHEAVEEKFFWPAVRDRVPDGDRLADHAVEQEQAAEHVLNDLIGLKADDPKFDELVRGFIADGREHIAYEETSVWPEPRKALGAEEADDLGTRLQQGKKAAPAHGAVAPRATGPTRWRAGPVVVAVRRLQARGSASSPTAPARSARRHHTGELRAGGKGGRLAGGCRPPGGTARRLGHQPATSRPPS